MHVNKTKFERNSSQLSHVLYWENIAYNLKRSIDMGNLQLDILCQWSTMYA